MISSSFSDLLQEHHLIHSDSASNVESNEETSSDSDEDKNISSSQLADQLLEIFSLFFLGKGKNRS